MKLVKILSAICLGTSLTYAASNVPGEDVEFPTSPGSSSHGSDFNSVPFEEEQGEDKEEAILASGTPNAREEAEAERVGGPMSDTDSDDSSNSDEEEEETASFASSKDELLEDSSTSVEHSQSGSNPPSPLVKYDPGHGGRMLPFEFEDLEADVTPDENIVRKFVVLTTATALHTMALMELLSTPVDLCYGPWAKGASYMCLINSGFLSFILAGYSPQLLNVIFPYVMSAHIMPVMYMLYYLSKDPTCPFDINKY